MDILSGSGFELFVHWYCAFDLFILDETFNHLDSAGIHFIIIIIRCYVSTGVLT